MISIVADAAFLLQETANVVRNTDGRTTKEVKDIKSLTQTVHLTSHFWGVLTHSARWPWGCILVWGLCLCWSCLSGLWGPLELQTSSMGQADKGLTTSTTDASYRTMQLSVLCNILPLWWITCFSSGKIMQKHSFVQWQMQCLLLL